MQRAVSDIIVSNEGKQKKRSDVNTVCIREILLVYRPNLLKSCC